MVKAAVLLAAALCAPVARAQTSPLSSPSPSQVGAAPWKQIYENGQTIFYIDTSSVQQTGQLSVNSLMEYRVPQVVGDVQVWSVVSRIKLNCDAKQMATVENTLYARQMGTGTVVQSQIGADTWRPPAPGSLGEMIWNTVCAKK